MSDLSVSLTDPDAVLMRQHNHGVHLRYRDHYLVDGAKARIILGVLVTAADVMENIPFLDMIWRACFRWQLRPRSATGDTTYGTVEIIRALEDAGIRAYVPITDWSDLALGAARLPQRDPSLSRRCHDLQCLSTKGEMYQKRRRAHHPPQLFQEYLDRVAAYHQTKAYKKAYQKRKVWVEGLFGEAQQWHGLRRLRLRGLWKVNCEGVMTATGQNLKRLLSGRGWGRRSFPSASPGVQLPAPDRALLA